MKHNTCPHCGARISLRQRLFPKKNGIHCAHCGGASYLVTGALWLPAYLASYYISMMIQYWFRLSWLLPVAVVVLTVVVLTLLSPLGVTKEITRREKIQRLVVVASLFVVFNFLYIWVMDHRPRVVAKTVPAAVCPPAGQSAP
jgi:hypothetical protein